MVSENAKAPALWLKPECEPGLVSVIIPCFNAECWVAEAIQSCLDQTYSPIEVIVVDDGSTDRSLEQIRKFDGRIRWETGPNCGGNAARNRGFALSQGTYIQFLDADDVLDPEKIERQISFLIQDKADVVSGEWRLLNETSSDLFSEGPLQNAMQSPDILCSLIDDAGWYPVFCYLIRRSFVEQSGGWDNGLSSMQDVDFSVSLAIHGARFTSVPHLCGHYRRPLQATTSTRNRRQFMNNCFHVYNRVEEYFNQTGWTQNRLHIVTKCYGALARYYFEHDKTMFEECLKKLHALNPHYLPLEPARLRLFSRLFGYRNAEGIALLFRKSKTLTSWKAGPR